MLLSVARALRCCNSIRIGVSSRVPGPPVNSTKGNSKIVSRLLELRRLSSFCHLPTIVYFLYFFFEALPFSFVSLPYCVYFLFLCMSDFDKVLLDTINIRYIKSDFIFFQTGVETILYSKFFIFQFVLLFAKLIIDFVWEMEVSKLLKFMFSNKISFKNLNFLKKRKKNVSFWV